MLNLLVKLLFILSWAETILSAELSVDSKDPHIKACPSLTIDKDIPIASPLFSDYPPYFYCYYEIQAPAGKRIKLHFTEFSLPYRSKVLAKGDAKYANLCEKNFLEIRTKNFSHEGIRYCGTELNGKQIFSEMSSLYLVFQSMPFHPEKGYTPRGFFAVVFFEDLPSKGANYPCGGLLSSDTSFILKNTSLPCEIKFGAPGTDKKNPILHFSPQNTECSVKWTYLHPKKNRLTEETSACNTHVQIPEGCDKITITNLTKTQSLEMELVFSERKTNIEYEEACGESKRLELNKTSEIKLPEKNRAELRCLWIFETPKQTSVIELSVLTATSVVPADDFYAFHMIVSPNDIKYNFLSSQISDGTYSDKHRIAVLPSTSFYRFSSQDETEKVLMLFVRIGTHAKQKFEASITAHEKSEKSTSKKD